MSDLNLETDIQNKLVSKFDFLKDHIRIQRKRRILAEAPQDKLEDVVAYAMSDCGFIYICTITGLDEGQGFGFIYHLTRTDGLILNLKITIPKEKAVLHTITGFYPSAEIYERELVDLLGVTVEGLKPGKRYPVEVVGQYRHNGQLGRQGHGEDPADS